MTQASGYTYLWDVDKDDNKYEDDKFSIFPRYDWGGYRMNSKCLDKMKTGLTDGKEPRLMALVKCVSPKIPNPFVEGEEFDKEQLGYLIVFIDIFTVICIFLFAEALNNAQEEYAAYFHSSTIEMTDFTIRVKRLPHHTTYGDKDDVLRAVLTAHFEEIIRDEIKLN